MAGRRLGLKPTRRAVPLVVRAFAAPGLNLS